MNARLEGGTRAQPFWLDEPYVPSAELAENLDADVLVVGGGITGISVAHHLASLKASCVLLEKGLVGSGSTGRCAGGLAPGTELDFCEAVDRFGNDFAEALWRFTTGAIQEIRHLALSDSLACDFFDAAGLYIAKSSGHLKNLEREYEAIEGSGLGAATLLKGPEAKEVLNSDKSAFGVLRYDNLAVVNPVKLVRGLASMLEKNAGVFENTAVTKIEVRDGGFLAKTEKGSVFGKKLVLATECFTNGLLGRRLTHPITVHSVVTRPVEQGILEAARLDQSKMVWDTGALYNFLRVTKDNRILIDGGDSVGSAERARGRRDESIAGELRETLLGLFPQLENVPIEYEWSGQMGFTTHRLPMIGEDPVTKNLFYSAGYGGHGLPFGFLAGRLLAEACTGNVSDQTRECLEMFKPRKKSQLAMALEGYMIRPYFAYLRMMG